MQTNPWSRRAFLGAGTVGVGRIALASLGLDAKASASTMNERPIGPHHPPRIKRVIHLYMAGGPSHLETFDEKPELARMDGQPMPASMTQGQQLAQLQGRALNCFGPRFPFASYGESGQRICTQFPHLGSIADRLCIIKSMVTDQINHDPAHTLFNTGTTQHGRPSMGSWITYGLGSETQDLPGFIVMTSVGRGGQSQPIAARQWQAGFLPSKHQGVELRPRTQAVHYVRNPAGVDRRAQGEVVQAINALNRDFAARTRDDEALTRIAQYELAFRMQASVPELTDLKDEPRSVLDAYGVEGADGSFAGNCLLARRLAERGVRFIQLYHRGWDHHGSIQRSVEITAGEVDRASAALIQDLEQRGLLDDTLVLFGGEFGRTPMAQGSGRDHHIQAFSYAMAGGGIRGGHSYGSTDELGYAVAEDPVHVRDLHATVLHLLGLDHERLTHDHRGLNLRLTGVEEAHILHPILA